MTRHCCSLLLGLLLFNACAAQNHAERKRQAALHYGMTHAQALAVIPNRSEIIIGEFSFPEGHMQAFQYTRYGNDAFKVPKYYLYFLNDTLVRKSPEEDLREGAKLALQDHAAMLARKEKDALTEEKRASIAEKKAAEDAKMKARAAEKQAAIAQKKADEAEKKATIARKKAEEAEALRHAHELAQKQEAAQPKETHKEKAKKHRDDYDDDEADW